MNPDTESDAGLGGTGAPPAVNEANRVPKGLTREYARPEIRVQWYASRCIHSGACIRALPSVFDSRRRPWIDLAGADADAIASAVTKCPTGALRYERQDGASNETPPTNVQITPIANGPYFVRGSFDIVDPDGTLHRETRVALCRCGQSKHLPYCDNTHRAIGFRTQP